MTSGISQRNIDLLNCLNNKGDLTRSQLMEHTELCWTTVFDNAKTLINLKVIRKYSKYTGLIGRQPVFFAIKDKTKTVMELVNIANEIKQMQKKLKLKDETIDVLSIQLAEKRTTISKQQIEMQQMQKRLDIFKRDTLTINAAMEGLKNGGT